MTRGKWTIDQITIPVTEESFYNVVMALQSAGVKVLHFTDRLLPKGESAPAPGDPQVIVNTLESIRPLVGRDNELVHKRIDYALAAYRSGQPTLDKPFDRDDAHYDYKGSVLSDEMNTLLTNAGMLLGSDKTSVNIKACLKKFNARLAALEKVARLSKEFGSLTAEECVPWSHVSAAIKELEALSHE